MSKHADMLRFHLAQGPHTARQLIEKMGISQPTLSRVQAGLATEIVRLGNGLSIQYALLAHGHAQAATTIARIAPT